MKLSTHKWEFFSLIQKNSLLFSYDCISSPEFFVETMSIAMPIYKESATIKVLPYLQFLLPSVDSSIIYQPAPNKNINIKSRAISIKSKKGSWKKKFHHYNLNITYIFVIAKIYNIGKIEVKSFNFGLEDAAEISKNNRIINVEDMSDFNIFFNFKIDRKKN